MMDIQLALELKRLNTKAAHAHAMSRSAMPERHMRLKCKENNKAAWSCACELAHASSLSVCDPRPGCRAVRDMYAILGLAKEQLGCVFGLMERPWGCVCGCIASSWNYFRVRAQFLGLHLVFNAKSEALHHKFIGTSNP